MFTGIIRHLGKIETSTQAVDGSIVFEIAAPFSQGLHEGDSVAVNGVCLTVLSHTNTTWTCRLMAETISKTTLGSLIVGATVHLELPTQADGRLHGHIVQGHVDAVCTITNIATHGNDKVMTFKPPQEFMPRITSKGSIALDGVSLTVVDVTNDTFTVSLMPYTLEHTTFGTTKVGDTVNMETDHGQRASWISGTVVQGDKRGTTLGFPTANIALNEYSQMPKEGIYAARVMIENDPTLYAAALHIGPRPTFKNAVPSVELHIINFEPRVLYGEKIHFTTIEKIRDVKKFESVEDLINAIAQDVKQATAILMYH